MLFNSIQAGSISLNNRIIMAPLTRMRSNTEHIPNELMAEYYRQRASAGLIISECTMIAENTSAFGTEPGIYNTAQINEWKKITKAVHENSGKIVMQIWHSGRAAHPNLNNGHENIAPSSIAISTEINTPQGKFANTIPREITTLEIPVLVQAYAQAAKNAIKAGFDGVEIHGANGYLVDQFLRDGTNKRTDNYGGSLKNRARFLFEILTAVSSAIGSKRVGLRISPLNSYNDMIDSDPLALTEFLAKELNRFSLAYLHIMRSDMLQIQTGDIMPIARKHYKGVLVGNIGYSAEEAEQAIKDGQLDAVAFGVAFIANPDLPARIKAGAQLNTPDPSTFYTQGAEGYTDYPTME